MENIKELCNVLEQLSDLHEELLGVENRKYDTMIKDDIEELDKIMTEEQVFYLRVKGMEQKREKLMATLGMKDKNLREVINCVDGEDRVSLITIQKKLLDVLTKVKKANGQCQILTEIRLHRSNVIMDKLSDKERKKFYSEKGELGNSKIDKNARNNKSNLIVSKKI